MKYDLRSRATAEFLGTAFLLIAPPFILAQLAGVVDANHIVPTASSVANRTGGQRSRGLTTCSRFSSLPCFSNLSFPFTIQQVPRNWDGIAAGPVGI